MIKYYLFYDMASGGQHKFEYVYLITTASSEEEAISKFEFKFNRDPFNVTCECCGSDYSLMKYESLEILESSWSLPLSSPLVLLFDLDKEV